MHRVHTIAHLSATLCMLIAMLLANPVVAENVAARITHGQEDVPAQQPLSLANDDQLDQIILGRSFFTIPWVAAPASTTARDGLGPLFNANTCVSCHLDNGSARTVSDTGTPTRALLFKLARPEAHDQRADNVLSRVGDPSYGDQIAINATGTTLPEAQTELGITQVPFNYPDGQSVDLQQLIPRLTHLAYGSLAEDTVVFLRQPGALAGLGLIERVSDAEILTWEDPQDVDGDGVSGRANRLSSGALGRYGWKATEPDLRAQIALAAATDMGLTNSLYPQEACQPAQTDCLAAPRGRPARAQTAKIAHDLTDQRLQAVTNFVASVEAPQAGVLDTEASLGSDTFRTIGCAACHRPTMRTQDDLIIRPMSDFLLHDMGSALADGVNEHEADVAEFRTAPLWGLGARVRNGHRFLHDARARVPEEAILWHGGEATASRDRFVNLDVRLRAAVLHYLHQL